jgi:hypothetical protein
MPTLTKHYRQTTYSDLYTVEYRLQPDGAYKLFCLEHPTNLYSADVRQCHLYPSREICVSSTYRVDSLEKAKAVASAFMDGYSQYVRTGVFPNGAKKVHV